MIDAGPVLSDPPGDHLRNAAIHQQSPDGFSEIAGSFLKPISTASEQGGAALAGQNPEQRERRNLPAAASLYAVGGMLTQWSCVIPRPRGEHLLNEIPANELAGLYSAAECLFGHDAGLTGGAPVDFVLAEHLTAAGYAIEALPLAARIVTKTGVMRYTGAAQILGDASRSARLKILPLHLCRELRWQRRGEGLAIEAATVVDLRQRRELTISAIAVVVACNAVLTPQLLFASRIWRDHLPALGRFLTEHPKYFGQVQMAPGLVQQIAMRAADSSRPDSQAATVPAPALTIPAAVGLGRPWHTQITRDPTRASARPTEVDRNEVIQLRWFAPCEPRPENEVYYARSARDALGMPQPTFDFSLSRHDRRVVKAMVADCRRVARVLGGFVPGFEGRLQPLGHSLHMAGTFRIGTNPETSVCDASSRVWGFENLYLGGNGTIPNAHSVNPTLTAAAIAIRAAGELSSTLAGRSPRGAGSHDVPHGTALDFLTLDPRLPPHAPSSRSKIEKGGPG